MRDNCVDRSSRSGATQAGLDAAMRAARRASQWSGARAEQAAPACAHRRAAEEVLRLLVVSGGDDALRLLVRLAVDGALGGGVVRRPAEAQERVHELAPRAVVGRVDLQEVVEGARRTVPPAERGVRAAKLPACLPVVGPAAQGARESHVGVLRSVYGL